MGKLKEEWKAAIQYIRKPYEPAPEEINQSNVSQKLARLFLILLLDLLCMLPLMGILSLVEHFGIVDLEDHSLKEMLEQYSVWLIFFLVVIGAPIAEEVLFRLHLSRRWNLIAGFMEIFSALANRTTRQDVANEVKAKWDRFYGPFFHLNAAAFAFIHLLNFQEGAVPLWIAPLMVLPQFVAGLYFGYIRTKNGNLFWSIALHALHNVVLISPILFFDVPLE